MTNEEKFIAALVRPLDRLETALQQLLLERNINTAYGVTLRKIGKIVGQRAQIDDDEEFRRYARATIAANKSNGLASDLIKVARLVVFDTHATIRADNVGGGRFRLVVAGMGITASVARILADLINEARGAGIRGVVEWSEVSPEETFTLDSGPGLDVGHLAGTTI